MFGFMKGKQPASTTATPNHSSATTAGGGGNRRTSSEPKLSLPDDDDDDYFGRGKPSRNNRNVGKDDMDSMSVQELENYAVDQAKQTTNSVSNCLKIAEDIREDATRTLDTLHNQGEQINRTHMMAVDMDKDLTKGEKLLNNLGGMFSKPWKPKKTKEITGPVSGPDTKGKRATYEQREKLGLAPLPKGKNSKTPPPEPTNAMEQVELEKAKQDDALSDLSDILGDLKGMANGMGSELERQNKALDNLSGDVDELNSRVKGANARARKLLK